MELSIPPEPLAHKLEFQKGLEQGLHEITKGVRGQTIWIASPLWSDRGWKEVLGEAGMSWPRFISLVNGHRRRFEDWIRDEAAWGDVISDLIDSLSDDLESQAKR